MSLHNRILYTAIFLVGPALAENAPVSRCGGINQPIEKENISCLVNELIYWSYPELVDALQAGRIEITEFRSNSYFLKTSISKGKFSTSAARRAYSIDVNPIIFSTNHSSTDSPSLGAIQGILAHELEHLVDYESCSRIGLIQIGAKEVFDPSKYERDTDLRAFNRGFATGIKSYREWIYKMLDSRALRKKKKRYYTPEEIDHWIRSGVVVPPNWTGRC